MGLAIKDMETSVMQLKLLVAPKLDEVIKQLKQLSAVYDTAVVQSLPTWRDSKIPNEDEVTSMQDEKFAKCRARISREKNLLVRMNAQLALVIAIRGIISDKAKRIEALNNRIANAECGDSPEVEAAKGRIEYIENLMDALECRMFVVVEDFARTRKLAVRCVNAATQKVVDMFPSPNNRIASIFSGSSTDIENGVAILSANNTHLKRWERAAALSFGARTKK